MITAILQLTDSVKTILCDDIQIMNVPDKEIGDFIISSNGNHIMFKNVRAFTYVVDDHKDILHITLNYGYYE